jgi:hypothetical protein
MVAKVTKLGPLHMPQKFKEWDEELVDAEELAGEIKEGVHHA